MLPNKSLFGYRVDGGMKMKALPVISHPWQRVLWLSSQIWDENKVKIQWEKQTIFYKENLNHLIVLNCIPLGIFNLSSFHLSNWAEQCLISQRKKLKKSRVRYEHSSQQKQIIKHENRNPTKELNKILTFDLCTHNRHSSLTGQIAQKI